MNSRSLKQIAEETRSAPGAATSHLEQQLALIAQHNSALNALAHVEEPLSRIRAAAIDRRDPGIEQSGSLLGTTFSARLSISVAGLPLSNGSTSDQPTIPAENASIIERLVKSGATCIAKGNIAERGKSYFTENPRYGRTGHPADPTYSPGGSGGGDAVAVATGMVDFAIGADAGGSVRIPANFCGLFGLSATHGVLSEARLGSQTTAIMRLLKGPGILTRSLEDLQMVFSAAAGFDAHDPVSCAEVPGHLSRPARIRLCTSINGVTPDRRIVTMLETACSRFQAAGAEIDRSPLPLLDTLAEPFVILAAQAQLLLEDTLALRNGAPLRLDQEGPHLRILRSRLTAELPPLTADELLYRWHQIDQARNQIASQFDQFDFLLLPVCATLPVVHNTPLYKIDGQELRTEQVYQFATAINALGLPAVAVPMSVAGERFPLGFQIAAPRFGEQRLFSLLGSAGFTHAR